VSKANCKFWWCFNSESGALVLAHSLRDAGTKKKLAILVTLDSVSAEVVSQLKVSFQRYLLLARN
jgi:glycogenin glucosyltransferase